MKTAIYMAKLACYDYQLSQQKASVLGAACFYLSAKICEKNKAATLATPAFLKELAKKAGETETAIVEVSKRLLAFSQNFEKIYPNLRNLNNVHASELTALAGK